MQLRFAGRGQAGTIHGGGFLPQAYPGAVFQYQAAGERLLVERHTAGQQVNGHG